MTPRRALVMRAFAEAYIEELSVKERVAFLRDQLLAVKDTAYEIEVLDAAIVIAKHAVTMTPNDIPLFPNPGVSP